MALIEFGLAYFFPAVSDNTYFLLNFFNFIFSGMSDYRLWFSLIFLFFFFSKVIIF